MLKNVVFDIGRVLLAFNPLEYLIKRYNNQYKAKHLYHEVFKSNEWIQLDKGEITNEEAIKNIAHRNPSYKEEIKECMCNWVNILEPIEGSIEILKRVKNAGYRTLFLSNFHLTAFERVYKKYSFFKYFDGGIVSAREKLIKPQRDIFIKLIREYYIKPEESIFIDDTKDNIDAAKEMGFKVICFKSSDQLLTELKANNILI